MTCLHFGQCCVVSWLWSNNRVKRLAGKFNLKCVSRFLNKQNANITGGRQLWASLKLNNATSCCFHTLLDWKRNTSSEKVRRWLIPLLWDHKVSPWLSPSLSQLWLSCRHPRTQSPGLAHRALDHPVPAATVDSTAVGPAPKSEMKRNKA